MKQILISTVLTLISITAFAADLPVKGTICWNKNTEPDLAGYKYFTGSSATPPAIVTNAGMVTTAPTPPTTAQACGTGQVGVLRDDTGKTGQQYVGVAAYDQTGNVSGYTIYGYTLPPLPDSTPPANPIGVTAK